MNIGEIHQAVTHRTDGPLTAFVLISRAIKVAAREGQEAQDDNKVDHMVEVCANLLYEELVERGMISEDESITDDVYNTADGS